MTWLQILAQAGVMASIIGAAIAIAAYFNGKHVKEGVAKLGQILAEIEKLAEQRHQDVIALLNKGFGSKLNIGQ